jgi:photosystem II stability/assembly factor-like uncharacterized protein
VSRGATVALCAAVTLLFCLAIPGTAFALPGWSVLKDPLAAATSLDAVDTFGDTGLVVAGAGGAVAVSGNGGATWTDISASALTSATLSGVAFTDAEHGVAVGPAGTILVGAPDGQGAFGWTVATLPADVTGDLRDVAMSGTVGYAVGTGGVVLGTVDGGATWEHESSPTAADLNAVAISSDGDVAAAVGAEGTLLVNRQGSWETRDSGATGNLRDVALPAGSAADTVYFCSATRVFSQQGTGAAAALPDPPVPSGGMSSLALVAGATSLRLVVAGSGGWQAGMAASGTVWATQTGGGTADLTALAAGDGALCYATTVAGRVERSLNAGLTYTLTLKAKPAAASSSGFRAIVTMGAKVDLSGTTNVLAPGVLLLEARPAGTTPWVTLASGGPGTTTLNNVDYPTKNTTYRLRFLFAGATAATGANVPVGVRHKVRASSTSVKLARASSYRVSGSVSPQKVGGVVEVWTDRAGNNRLGSWHRIPVGGYVDLVNGTTFTTRRFGAPVRETYHLKILMRADSRHLGGWSPRITVTVR